MLSLSANLAKHTAMHEQVCRLEIVQLHLATQHRRHFVAVTLTSSEPLAADDEITHQLGDKPFVGVLSLLHKTLELLGGLGDLREASRTDIQPENMPPTVSEKQIPKGANHDQLHTIADQPPPVVQEGIALGRIKTDSQFVPGDAHDVVRTDD